MAGGCSGPLGDGIVTRYMDDSNFQKTIFAILAKEKIYKSILEKPE